MSSLQDGPSGAGSAGIVLLISRSEGDYLALSAILKDAGWPLQYAHDCQEARKVLHDERVAVVMAGCQLPGSIDWRDVLAETREIWERPPLVLLVDVAGEEVRREALGRGVFDLLERPLLASQVLACLQLAVPRAAAAESARGTILVVEAREVAAFIQALLERHGYRVANCPYRRVAALLDRLHVDLVITNRPDDVAAFDSSLRVLYTCALPDPERLRRLPNRAVAVLQKPFLPEELLGKVRRLLLAPAAAAAEIRFQRRQAGLRLAPSPLDRLRARTERAGGRRNPGTHSTRSAHQPPIT